MQKEITIRKATLQDLDIIADFQRRMALESENLRLDPDIVSAGVRAVFDDSTKGTYFVAETAQQIVGALLTTYEWSDWRNGFVLWIQSVFVEPQFRRQGIYRLLYEHVQKIVDQRPEFKGIRLYVDKNNAAAQKVYKALKMNSDHYQLFEWMPPKKSD